MQNKTAPRWDLKNIYPDFKSKKYAESKKKIPALTSKFEKHLKAFSEKDLKKWLVKALDILNEFNAEAETLYAYASAVYTTDTENKEALSELNSISALFVPFTPLGVRFSNILASVSKEVKALIKNDRDLKYASFYLEDTLFWQKKQMSEEADAAKAERLAHDYHALQTELEQSGWYFRQRLADETLRGLGFTSEDFTRLTDEFSGGWQMRIALAKILLSGADIIILDEPTNYLDIEARSWLELWLKKFTGGFLLVSHDRSFLDATVNETYELFNGTLKRYAGTYTNYEKTREARKSIFV